MKPPSVAPWLTWRRNSNVDDLSQPGRPEGRSPTERKSNDQRTQCHRNRIPFHDRRRKLPYPANCGDRKTGTEQSAKREITRPCRHRRAGVDERCLSGCAGQRRVVISALVAPSRHSERVSVARRHLPPSGPKESKYHRTVGLSWVG